MPAQIRQIPFSAPGRTPERWQIKGYLHAVATAVVLCAAFVHHGTAQALVMGRIVVQSALGEPLQAEIDLADISPSEAASLRVSLGSDEAFRTAGLTLQPAMGSLRISLQQRADGRNYLRLTTSNAVSEPFVDLIVEAQWASGRILRDYTLLLNPPKTGPNMAAVPMPPALSPQEAPMVSAPKVDQRPAFQAPTVIAASNGPVKVQAGDTASRIAGRHRTASASLDQMLVAMLRGNPQAFINGNVNRIKAGALVDLPAESQILAIAPEEASQLIAAQSRDFNEFRRRLAADAQTVANDASEQQSSGQVQAEVQDQRTQAATPDKLTLSKGSLTAMGADEEKIAQQRQARDTSTRVAELSRNIEDLAKIQATVPREISSATPQQDSVPGAASGATGDAPKTAAPTPTSGTDSSPSLPSENLARPIAGADDSKNTTIVDLLTDSPLVLPAAGSVLAMLAGVGLFVARRRKKDTRRDNAFLESSLRSDAFFTPAHTVAFNTSETPTSASHQADAHRQLDQEKVDPIAEADTCLTHGHDLQAEEILKKALPKTPTRVPIHIKLLEIYAKRGDARAFNERAWHVHDLTQGKGVEWAHACNLGHALDPSNPLYLHGSGSDSNSGQPASVGTGLHAKQVSGNTVQPGATPASGQSSQPGLDLELDMELDLNLNQQFTAPIKPKRTFR